MTSNMADGNQKKNICYQVLLQKREFTPRGTHKQKSNTFSNT